jgi:hypothetical protein
MYKSGYKPRTRKLPSTYIKRNRYNPSARRFGRTNLGLIVYPEKKYFDSLKSNTAIAASTNWTDTEYDPATSNTLFSPTKGTNQNQRVGRKVSVHKIKIKGQVTIPAQAATNSAKTGSKIRILLVQDKQTNAAQAQGEQIMQAPGTATSTLATNSFQSLANFGKFRVIKDLSIIADDPNFSSTQTADTYDTNGKVYEFSMNAIFKKPVVVHFNSANNGTVADIVDNSFHIIANTSSAGFVPVIDYNCRTVYTDS